ncbi:hypothetical protein [Burkholderia contaminans]|uniref:hypothetical protein n=1 Tax=Burkholderia contaminans TaxID=488447 RepID=UPI001452E86A|nr:hypothetical protein [Burkholderia contaminans]MCA8157819.1 hypothetical protein [Burkholderia contaminans]VWD59936.1 hypothetical protein BCO19218_07162 [Burkholderia contaminans]
MNAWPTSLVATARRLGIVSPDEPVLLGAPPLSESEQLAIGCATSELLKLICSLPRRYKGNNPEAYMRHIGFSPAAGEILRNFGDPDDGNVFARADMVRDSLGRWRMIEMNIGSSVGGMFYSSLPRLAGLSQKRDVLEQWARHVTCHHLGNEVDHVAFVEDPALIDALRYQLGASAAELQRISGRRCSVASADEFRWDGRELYLPSGPIDCIYATFTEADIERCPNIYAPIIEAYRHKRITMPMGLACNLVNNKGVLALLWDLVDDGLLNEAEANLVKCWIPETRWITTAQLDRLLRDRHQWVVKPIDGACGRDVLCGIDYPLPKWEEHIRQILQEPAHSFVAQRFHAPEVRDVAVGFGEELDSVQVELARIVWGVFVYGTHYLGCLVRSKPLDGVAVINHATGALVGPLAPSEG